jgi:4-hydroxy-3-methylbut-2-en-1-yl diphosphate synthase IspG/GcpE
MTASVDEDARQIMLRLTEIDIQCCPHCGRGQMMVMSKIPKGSRIRESP